MKLKREDHLLIGTPEYQPPTKRYYGSTFKPIPFENKTNAHAIWRGKVSYFCYLTFVLMYVRSINATLIKNHHFTSLTDSFCDSHDIFSYN